MPLRFSLQKAVQFQAISSWLESHRSLILRVINGALIVLGTIAVVSLIVRIGFFLTPDQEQVVELLEQAILYVFALQAFLKLALAPNKRAHLRMRWLELIIFSVILLYLFSPLAIERLLMSLNPQLTPENITSVYLVITQFFVVLALLPATLRYSSRVMTANVQPATILLISFLALAIGGAGFLMLPKATAQSSLTIVDALFMATSAVCVTGLTTVDTATTFSHTGHWILLVLIQVGGLGIMTLTTFFAVVGGAGTRLKEYIALRDLLGEESLGQIRSLLFQIGFYTFVIEAMGAIAIYYTLDLDDAPLHHSPMFFAAFHSISAFCNAGFSLLSENFAAPPCHQNAAFLFVVMSLVTIGGLGFPALSSLSHYVQALLRRLPQARLSLHAKLVFITSSLLIVIGTVGFFCLEHANTLRDATLSSQLLDSLFHSIIARTAGFNTLNVGQFTTPTLFFLVALMWIGASPSSTGGGIKTTTAALALMNIVAIASGRNKIELFRRRVPDRVITRAFSTALLSLLYIVAALFVLLLTEQEKSFRFEALLFEVVSAVSTVGLSTGITSQLSDAGKLVLTVSMLIGRVGFLNIIIALTRPRIHSSYDYAEETVIVS
ncbi:MAG: potassium transporter TrkG [Chloroherpetonaceae bacterium]|nr:ATPase [Chloroherpetonaceae bacterium]MCS7210871.1 ATPase [Chloroherpetonaceae bacterium]MDW8019854.1 potassium transporter TrkG [Chloroherpetonaceae bacterium]